MIILPTPINCAHTCRRVLAPANGRYVVLIRPPNLSLIHAFVVAYVHVCAVVADYCDCIGVERETLILYSFVDIQCDCMYMKGSFLIGSALLGQGLLARDMH